MDISTLKAGDEVYVFDRSKGKYIKRVVEIGKVGCPYFYDDPRGYFRTRATVPLDDTSDAVTAEELPAAKKRHAARRKAENEAEEARKKRVFALRNVRRDRGQARAEGRQMSKQRNKRNTRRGRAKRWIYNGYGCWFHVRRSGNATFIMASLGEWVVDDAKTQTSYPSRAAAMRAAEYLARGR